MMITKVADKTFVGKDILYAGGLPQGPTPRATFNYMYWGRRQEARDGQALQHHERHAG